MAPLSWHWCSVNLPPLWEVTAYSAGREKGSMQCYTRDGFVAELGWRRTKGIPDQRRIMAEVHRRHLQNLTGALGEKQGEQDIPVPALSFRMAGDFVVGFHRVNEPFQASLYQVDTGILLEWVFPAWNPLIYSSLVKPLLLSYQPNHGDPLHWAIFGIDVQLPARYQLTEITPLPGHTVITWSTKKRAHVVARRWALPEELLGPMDLPAFGHHLCRKLFRKVQEVQPRRLYGHEGVHVEFSMKGQVGFERIVGQWWKGEILLWWDREAGRITALEQYAPKNQPEVNLHDIWSE